MNADRGGPGQRGPHAYCTTQLTSSAECHAAHLHTMMVLFLGAFPHKRSGRGGYGLPLTVPATRGDELPFLLQPGSGGYGHPL